ncbi:MAG: S1/P1 nuclease [Ferruginibacter sp.]
MKSFFKTIILMVVICYIPFRSKAWGVLGHRIVGEIADSYLTTKAKKAITKILGNESIAMSSNWADFIKSDPAYGYLYNWHFINLNPGYTREGLLAYLVTDTTTDAYTKINYMSEELKKRDLPAPTKLLYLRLLIHIVGDIHQPLHVGRLEDLGGNRIKVAWFRDSSNLHQVWDERLINFQQLSYTEYAKAINHTTPFQRKEWFSEPVGSWIYQSYQCAQLIYGSIKPDQRLDYKYNFENIDMLNQQLLTAGVHLAALLNKIFG